jgi:uncharacterized cupredoxin-like copper-binding protein
VTTGEPVAGERPRLGEDVTDTPGVRAPGRRPGRTGRVLALLAAIFAAPVLVAVGVSAASAPSGAYALTVTIDIHYSHYEPSTLRVPVGVPVRFVIRNQDPIDHEWIVGDAAVQARHRTGTELHHGARPTELSIAALQTTETIVTFAATGQLQYICHLPGHEQFGMVGTLDIS